MSIKKAIDVKWRDNARKRIKSCDYVVFLCGEYTDSGVGVSAELSITQEEKITYFLLRGRRRRNVKKPKGAKSEDQEYNWTRNNLKLLLEGKRGSFLLKE
ncbi:MAG: hypothetical protein LKF69_04300 [Bacilli bacterium]|jgi:hypothetical protein|nr:hypothetical protein [Bacilli bacterium]MCH4236000.1 hypothetical protein [Bacilli bacterium]